jgi:hypothetical protein
MSDMWCLRGLRIRWTKRESGDYAFAIQPERLRLSESGSGERKIAV